MPILWDELNAFVSTWNAHRIRAQLNRSQHVAGVPDELYRIGEQHGFLPDSKVLSALESTLPKYGKYHRRWEIKTQLMHYRLRRLPDY